MPELSNRDELESKLASALGARFTADLSALLDSIGDPPEEPNLPADFWDDVAAGLIAIFSTDLLSTYMQSAEFLLGQINIGTDWAGLNQNAINWLNQYSFDLVRGINDTSREVLRTALTDFYSQNLTKEQLAQLLEPSFGPVRAEMIAITETTRASVEGERALIALIERENLNIRMVPIWQTANDDRVCPICGPKHDQPIEDGEYPPAHPRCRCWVNYEMEARE
jgi:hypothetical protein